MRKLVLYAASDRYNYGDLTMPILFNLFVDKYCKYILDEYEVIYASVTDSDLSVFGGAPTISLGKLKTNIPDGSVILMAGGAVIGADVDSQFLYS